MNNWYPDSLINKEINLHNDRLRKIKLCGREKLDDKIVALVVY